MVIKGNLHLEKNSVIKSGTYIEGPIWIGKNCTIGPNSYLREGTLMCGRNKEGAEALGWKVMNYILDPKMKDVNKVPPFKKELDNDRHGVSYMPAGVGTGTTPNNPELSFQQYQIH